MKGTNLGEFEELVLLVVCLLAGRAYGLTVLDEIHRQTGREVTISAIHSALYRLERKGYLRSSLGDPTMERGNRETALQWPRKLVYLSAPD